jgi:hypothetical protein
MPTSKIQSRFASVSPALMPNPDRRPVGGLIDAGADAATDALGARAVAAGGAMEAGRGVAEDAGKAVNDLGGRLSGDDCLDGIGQSDLDYLACRITGSVCHHAEKGLITADASR